MWCAGWDLASSKRSRGWRLSRTPATRSVPGGDPAARRGSLCCLQRGWLGNRSADDGGRDAGLDPACSLELAPTEVVWGTVCASGGLPRPLGHFRGSWLPGPQGPRSPGLAAWTGLGSGPLPFRRKHPTEAEGQGARARGPGVPSPHPAAGTESGEQLKAVPSLSDTKGHRPAGPGRPSEAMWGSGTSTWTRGRKRGDLGCGREVAR